MALRLQPLNLDAAGGYNRLRDPVRLRTVDRGCKREWRNWQTRQVEGLVVAIPCRFKSCFPHWQSLDCLSEAGSKVVRPAVDGSVPAGARTLYFASSDEEEISALTKRFADILGKQAPPGLRWHYQPMPAEKHSTIFHPAALQAFRMVFPPE